MDTLVPLIFVSDETHLLKFAGDKTEWPVYMTIGNVSSKIHQMPWMQSVIMFALLPIPITNRNISQTRLVDLQQTNQEVLNVVHWGVLPPPTVIQNPCAESGYYNILCAEGNIRCCKLVLAASVTDCPEYRDRQHLEQHVCFWCKCPQN